MNFRKNDCKIKYGTLKNLMVKFINCGFHTKGKDARIEKHE
jgi:hypothetical protein